MDYIAKAPFLTHFLLRMVMQVIVHVSFLGDISYNLYSPSATIDSSKTAVQRITPFFCTIWSEFRGNIMDF